MSKTFKHVLVAIYSHPELYPPTIAAIEQLSKISQRVEVLTRNMLISQWEYPENVTLTYVNEDQFKGFEIEKINLRSKIKHFVKFVSLLKSIIKKNNSDLLLVNDSLPLFAAYLIKRTIKKQKSILWYHNHDVVDLKRSGKFSLMGIAARFEDKAFNLVDVFSLPSKERIQYFPDLKNHKSAIILPNYPLKSFYSKAEKITSNSESIRVVFQGSIGPGHGLEEIIEILSKKINGKKLELHLVGKVRESYLVVLDNLVKQHGVQDHFTYHGMKPFAKLPYFLSQFDIGLAIHKPYNVTYSTGGTASNKIYEYAACGMPIILFDSTHYREYLEEYKWTFFTDLTANSLLEIMSAVDSEKEYLSELASRDFHNKFNFESSFKEQMIPVLSNFNK